MKKLLAVLLAALLLAAPAFAQTASLAGEWTMTKTVASGVVMSPEAYGLSMTIVLNPDGTAFARQTINGAPMEENGTWTQAGNTVTITSQLTGEVSTFTLQADGTLLAMVDSSVGGKTGVNLPAGKNQVGAFYQPLVVLADPDTLQTLPPDTLADGVAESIKYGVLGDEALFELLGGGNWQSQMEHVIATCVAAKAKLVEEDERDTGSRQLLNLGHTLGHGIEKCSHFSISHGHAVAVGMVYAARLAQRLGLCGADVRERIEAALIANNLPVSAPYGAQALCGAALSDKKRAGGQIVFVLPRAIGACELRRMDVADLPRLIRLAVEE